MITISLKNLENQLNYLLCPYLKLFGMKWIPPQYTMLFSMPHTEFNGYFWGWWWAWKDTSPEDSEILFFSWGSLGEVWFGEVSLLPGLGSSRSSLGWGHRLGEGFGLVSGLTPKALPSFWLTELFPVCLLLPAPHPLPRVCSSLGNLGPFLHLPPLTHSSVSWLVTNTFSSPSKTCLVPSVP